MNWWALRRKIHVSWMLAVFSLSIVIGVIAAQYVPPGWFHSIIWLSLGLGLIILGVWRGKLYALIFVVLAGGLIGLWRGSLSASQLAPYRSLIGHTVNVRGTVSEDADIGKDNELVLRLGNISVNNHELAGAIWVSASTTADVKRSDIVTVKGELGVGFGSFAASMYRATLEKVQRPEPGDVARQVRDGFADNVRKTIAEPEASLGIGYLLGQRRALPEDLSESLRIAGLTHVIVASGYNLTILVRLARRLFAKVSKYLAALSAGGMILAFIAVTGMSPSMSRAGLVAGLSLLAWYYGRKFHPLVLLPLAAAVTLLINPSYGWSDLGWQLSFAAFAGVMILAPLGQRYFFGDKKPGTIRQILGETMSAQIATLPILVLAFGQFSNVAIIANLLILPLVPLAMLLTFIAGFGALFLPILISFIGIPAYILLKYMTSVAYYFAHLPWAQTALTINSWALLVYYGGLLLICVYIWRTTKFNLLDSNIVE
jgi:competence protein ComEC